MESFRQLTTVTCVSVCIFPVTLLYFREVSVASPIANLLLVRFVR
ncbi:MAG: ComEC/Rec2 family competence protein [Ruminococcus callidus]